MQYSLRLWWPWLALVCGLALRPLSGVDHVLEVPAGGPPGSSAEVVSILAAITAADEVQVKALLAAHPELMETRLTLASTTTIDPYTRETVNVPGISLLHVATVAGDTATMQALLDAGIAVDDPDDWWLTPLDYAVWYANDMQKVQYLLDHGANINAQDGYGRTALHLACYYQYDHREAAVVYLLEHGADANIRGPNGLNAIQTAREAMTTNRIGPVELSGLDGMAFYALYQHTARIPGWAQLGLYLAVLAVLTGWIRQVMRRRVRTPEQRQAEIDQLRVLRQWNESVTVVPVEQIQAYQRHREQYEGALLRTLVPVTAGVVVTLFVLMDPILPHCDTHGLLLSYAGMYLAAYGVLWIPQTLLRGLGLLAVWLLTVFGIFTLFYQGSLMAANFGEYAQFGMYTTTAVLFLVQLFFVVRASGLHIQVQLFNADVRRAREQLLQAADTTGMEPPSGAWDEGQTSARR